MNPGVTEILDNGKDDDCNPDTGDNSSDIDNDGLADDWEIANFGNLVDQDGDGDPDEDDLTNEQEENLGSDPNNARPDAPILLFPDDDAQDVSLMTELEVDTSFSEPEGDGHALTRWQISTDETFGDDTQLVLDFESDTALYVAGGVWVYPGSSDTDFFWRAQLY